MIRALWNSRSGMQAMQNRLDAISNNISNAETTSYKRVNVTFNDLIYEQLERRGYPTNNNGVNQHLTGSGVKANPWLRDESTGNLIPTDIDTDLAIDGPGYFKVTKADGTVAYTRAGSFNLDVDGDLVSPNGDRLEITFNNGDKKRLEKGKFNIDESGNVLMNDNDSYVNVGKINLYQPLGQDSMYSIGDNLYAVKDGAQINQVAGSNIYQGLLEVSNVDVGSEVSNMIVTQRAFEFNAKCMSTEDDMMGMINNLRSK